MFGQSESNSTSLTVLSHVCVHTLLMNTPHGEMITFIYKGCCWGSAAWDQEALHPCWLQLEAAVPCQVDPPYLSFYFSITSKMEVASLEIHCRS